MRKKKAYKIRSGLLKSILLMIAYGVYWLYPTDQAPKNFSEAKRIARTIHHDAVTFYCACPIIWQGNRGLPDWAACGYQPRQDSQRASRIEWEHVVPAWQFGHQRRCWQQGGRRGCGQDPVFNQIEADLHNLQPAIGEINGDRKHYAFAEWAGGQSPYGRCAFKVDRTNKRVEPPPQARGAIARTYLYMGERYQLTYTPQQLQIIQRWHQHYPVTDWECERDRRVAKHQGHHNPYVDKACRQQRAAIKP